jgi:hypothetical protein
LERKIAQAADGRLAMAEYQQQQQAAVDRMAVLKEARLARDAEAVRPVKTNKAAVKRRK